MKKFYALCGVWLLVGSMFIVGCGNTVTPTKHWLANRGSDFLDIFCIGAGVSSENNVSAELPPSFGVYLEATRLFNIGYIRHAGATIELEGRGAAIYDEDRTVWGFGTYRNWEINQGQMFAYTNFYKDTTLSAAWHERMTRTEALQDEYLVDRSGGYAKHLVHNDTGPHEGYGLYPRGWHSWEYIGLEIGIPDPFITHHGITLRAGFDISEFADFVTGFFFYDFLKDDRRDDE